MITRCLFIALSSILIFVGCKDDMNTESFSYQQMTEQYAMSINESIGHFHQKVLDLNKTISNLNSTSNIEDIEQMQDQYKLAVLALYNIKVFDIGAFKSNLLQFRITQFPTKEDAILAIIEGTQEIDANLMGSLGANAKGIHTIEFLLFQDKKSTLEIHDLFVLDEQATRRQAYLKEVSIELKNLSERMLNIWNEDFKVDFISATAPSATSSENALYNQSTVIIGEIINSIRTPYEAYTNENISPNIENLVFRNSQISIEVLQNALTSLQNIYDNETQFDLAGHLDFVKASWDDGQLVSEEITQTYETVNDQLKNIQNLEESIINKDPEIDAIIEELKNLLVLYRSDMASWLSLILLVGDADGD